MRIAQKDFSRAGPAQHGPKLALRLTTPSKTSTPESTEVETNDTSKPGHDCWRCNPNTREALHLPPAAVLHLAVPLRSDTGPNELRDHLTQAGFSPSPVQYPGVLSIPFTEQKATELINSLATAIGEEGIADYRALVLPEGTEPTLGDLMQTQPLSALVARVRGQWLSDLLDNGRLFSHFQPIVPTAAPETVFGFECLLRAQEDAGFISPGRIYQVARAAQMMHVVDREARFAAIRGASGAGVGVSDEKTGSPERRTLAEANIFINFLPTAIYDPDHCLQTTIAAIREVGIHPHRVVFEVVESEHITDLPHLANILRVYRNAGFRVALDDLGAGYGSLTLLSELKPDFVKLDAALVRNAGADKFRSEVASRLLDLARALDIRSIAEGIETADELAWVRDHGADYAQGYYIARPGTPPPLPLKAVSA